MEPTENRSSNGSGPIATPPANGLDYELRKTRAYELLFGEPLHVLKMGRFTVLERIGAGGMGEVYAAYDQTLDRKVALKLVRRGSMSSPTAQQRLLREAQSMAKVAHPNVVPVYEVGQERGRVYISMEFVEGQTLADWLAKHKEPTAANRSAIFKKFVAIGRGLRAAHRADLVHRDFKPANVLIGTDGRPRVVDFGLARINALLDDTATSGAECEALPTGDDDPAEVVGTDVPTPFPGALRAAVNLTRKGQILGTPRYMAPEQMVGKSADRRSDQFSFCVALYEALYGERPFAGTTLPELRKSVEAEKVRAPERDSGVPAPVWQALKRGLARDPDKRFPDMDGLLDVLLSVTEGRRGRWRSPSLLLVIAVALVALYASTAMKASNPCEQAGSEIDEVWTDERRASLRDRFQNSPVEGAADIWPAVEAKLDNYVNAWRAQVFASCQESRVRGSETEELYSRRIACLQPGLEQLEALLLELDRGEPETIESAGQMLEALYAPSMCRDDKFLAYGLEPPGESEVEAVATIREEVLQARLFNLSRRSERAEELTRALLTAAESLNYQPVRAEVIGERGAALVRIGNEDSVSKGEALLREASLLSTATRHDRLAVDIWYQMGISAVHNQDTDITERNARLESMRAVAARAGSHEHHQAAVAHMSGLLAYRKGQYPAARDHHQRALDLVADDKAFPDTKRAAYLQALGKAMLKIEAGAEAESVFERTLALLKRELGSNHPRIGDVRLDLAILYLRQGQEQRGEDILSEILDDYETLKLASHRLYGKVALELAEVYRKRGALSQAQAYVEQAGNIYDRHYGRTSSKRADVDLRLGAIAYRRGRYAQATDAYQSAVAILRAKRRPDDLKLGYPLASLAEAQVGNEQYAQALESIILAKQIFLARWKKLPASHAAFIHTIYGRALLGLERVGDAVTELEDAVRLYSQVKEKDPMAQADALWGLVLALDASPEGTSARALDLARDALDMYRQQGPEVQTPAEQIETWLASQGKK